MGDDNLTDLTRRKMLGALGAVGAGAALGGAGTAAFFSDEETFEGNQLVAGSLDLKVDWQQTYSGPDGLVPVNAYPDHDADGLQSVVRGVNGEERTVSYELHGADSRQPITLYCEELASGDGLPEGVFANEAHPDQTHLVELTDVKPGDSGEITFSLHLCDNPGYVWLGGELTENRENSVTEPEANDPDEANDTVANATEYEASLGETEDTFGELADEILVTIWYDADCDNVFDEAESAVGDRVLLENVKLSEALEVLGAQTLGLPLDGDVTDEAARSCFAGESQHCIGFEWWLPVDHANEIQTDSVAFDLSFYTEQCRHNDGTGMETLSTGFADWRVQRPDGTVLDAQVLTPHPNWVEFDPTKALWVSDEADDAMDQDPEGDYRYTNTFTLETDSEMIVQSFSADNSVRLELDGTEIGAITVDEAFRDVSGPIQETVAAGEHTLTGVVHNDENTGPQNPNGFLLWGWFE